MITTLSIEAKNLIVVIDDNIANKIYLIIGSQYKPKAILPLIFHLLPSPWNFMLAFKEAAGQ